VLYRNTQEGVHVTGNDSRLVGAVRQKITSQPGYSTLAAGWSEQVMLESCTIAPSEWPELVLERHRIAVFLDHTPVRITAKVDGRSMESFANAGHIRVLPQGVSARSIWSAPLQLAVLEFSPALVDRLLDGRGHRESEQLVPHCYVADAIAHDLTRRIIAELKAPTEQLFGEMLSLTLALHVLQRYGRARVDVGLRARLSALRAQRVVDYVHANLGGRISVAALARVAEISDAHFARAFRATFDESPHRMVLHLRLQRAIQLVTAKRLSLAEAAVTAGFCDQAHFTNAARRHLGVTPGELLD
jgi:AraC family transcriptional regulator